MVFLWGLLWAIFFITDGFDLGIGSMIPFLGDTELEKRKMYNAIGPVWDGNEVWLITAGGVTFAAFPMVYAVMFSTMYTPLMLILFGLIFRGVAIEFRENEDSKAWKLGWDICMCVGSFLPALLFGIAFANIFQGIPFDSNGRFYGDLLTFINPYGLLGGILFVLLFLSHGAIWLCIKTDGHLQEKAHNMILKIWPTLLTAILVFVASSRYATNLLANYQKNPIFYSVLLMAVVAIIAVRIFVQLQQYWRAWFSSAITIFTCTFFGIIGLYPNMYPSLIDPSFHLTAHNASSSPLTLTIMLVVVLLFIPVVIGYQVWAYCLFKEKVSEADLIY
ncbi:MAG: cytochrome d ubiquinol oxidase subunit II [Candidatus Magnetoglobus multicellularis str. Araruama]|uniref:Cytochrome d ubiquinol oxidase subunit II n=1 Tax=Candidatus Magnetoglobus multicellularis str. Araruama TaxID=890399 RepID=A0A1V1PEX7_9BACT|nr:MAG: cytochrome d ubiquinol oxidase subunit II [Candidatus Magnetoglobus multicellularis str. Araruama]